MPGYTIEMLARGEMVSAESMLSGASSASSARMWLLRGVGVLGVWAGWAMVLGPASYVASFVPLLGRLVGCVLSLVAFSFGVSQALIIIGVAWLWFRPMLATALLVIAAFSLGGGLLGGRAFGSRGKTTGGGSGREAGGSPDDYPGTYGTRAPAVD